MIPATKILCVVGARPNLMKIAPIMRALSSDLSFRPLLVHTGQHYDDKLSRVFFEELEIPRPDVHLEVGSGTLAVQTSEVMRRFEPVVQAEQPQAVLVVGDVNSTVACALVASRFHLAKRFRWKGGTRSRPVVVHVEAGLRSFDDDMPEEVNRRVTDSMSDVLFVSEPSGMANLQREGVDPGRCHFVGNVMIDTLVAVRARAMLSDVTERLNLSGPYGVVTLHRPSNVDEDASLRALFDCLSQIGRDLRLVFPVHPRTRARLQAARIESDPSQILLVDPLGYFDFMKLVSGAQVVLTDSGGIQEETTVLGVPCITLRDNTERPITIAEGTNRLAGTDPAAVRDAFSALRRDGVKGRVPALWDGQAAIRIVKILRDQFNE
jgi:UDP-N-acetylglucosamine 2-epimerase (non-hydrolysing)